MLNENSWQGIIVRIYDKNGYPIGVGFFINESQIATCAHVIDRALGCKPSHIGENVKIDAPMNPSYADQISARIVYYDDLADISGLVIETNLISNICYKIPLSDEEELYSHPFVAYGCPENASGVWSDGKISKKTREYGIQLESLSLQKITKGFSGSPVWDNEKKSIVGMVSKVYEVDKIAFMHSCKYLGEKWAAIRLALSVANEKFVSEMIARTEEIKIINEKLLKHNLYLCAPPGMGKTFLLKNLKDEYEKQGWSVVFFDFSKKTREFSILSLLLLLLEKVSDTSLDYRKFDQTTLENILSNQIKNKKIFLVLDNVDSVIDIPSITVWIKKNLCNILSSHTSQYKILLSGQKEMPDDWKGLTPGGKFDALYLRGIKTSDLLEPSIEYYIAKYGDLDLRLHQQRNSLWPSDLRTMSRDLQRITAGYPLAIYNIFQNIAVHQDLSDISYFSSKLPDFCQRFFETTKWEGIFETIKPSRDTKMAFQAICIFRFVWPTLILTDLSKSFPAELGGNWEPFSQEERESSVTKPNWWGVLIRETPFFVDIEKRKMFQILPEIRNLFARSMQLQNNELYKARNLIASKIFEQLILNKSLQPTHRVSYLLEYLYHSSQIIDPIQRTKQEDEVLLFIKNNLAELQEPSSAHQFLEWFKEDELLQLEIENAFSYGFCRSFDNLLNSLLD